MAWHYDPPTPQTEADNAMSSYKARLRAEEARNRLDVDVDDSQVKAPNPIAALIGKIARIWRRTA